MAVNTNFDLDWLVESLELSKKMNDINIYTEVDAFDKFMGSVDVKIYKLPYLNVIYIYEYLYDSWDGDSLCIYNIYIITTTTYIPKPVNGKGLSQKEKEELLNFVKSLCNSQ